MNILLTSAGRRVSLVRGFQNECRSLAPGSSVFAADQYPGLSAACQVADASFELPAVKAEHYIETLLAECRQRNISVVIPTIDTELRILAGAREKFVAEGIEIIVSDVEFIDKCADKRITSNFFRERGFDTPEAYDPSRLVFPVFAKPYDGSLSSGAVLLRSEKDIPAGLFADDRMIFLEYIDHEKHAEFTVDMYFDRSHRLITAVPRRRLFVRGGEVNKGITEKNALLPLLRSRLASVEGVRGCINAQFFVREDGERTVAIEINARFGGGYPLSYKAGANFPGYIIKEYILRQHDELQYDEDWEDALLMLRYDDEVFVRDYRPSL